MRRKAREQAAVEREQARRARAVLGELTLGRLARAAGFDQPNHGSCNACRKASAAGLSSAGGDQDKHEDDREGGKKAKAQV